MSSIPHRLAFVTFAAVLAAGCASGGGKSAAVAPGAPAAPPAAAAPAAPVAGKLHRLADGLVYEDLVLGSGTMAENGLTATVHYTGWLTDGTKFDSSLDHGQPLSFTLGEHRVIQGWEEGVKGMRIGGKRKLTIPASLGYGDEGTPGGPIPPRATLVFEIQLLDVK